jgi:hypothetical protein
LTAPFVSALPTAVPVAVPLVIGGVPTSVRSRDRKNLFTEDFLPIFLADTIQFVLGTSIDNALALHLLLASRFEGSRAPQTVIPIWPFLHHQSQPTSSTSKSIPHQPPLNLASSPFFPPWSRKDDVSASRRLWLCVLGIWIRVSLWRLALHRRGQSVRRSCFESKYPSYRRHPRPHHESSRQVRQQRAVANKRSHITRFRTVFTTTPDIPKSFHLATETDHFHCTACNSILSYFFASSSCRLPTQSICRLET